MFYCCLLLVLLLFKFNRTVLSYFYFFGCCSYDLLTDQLSSLSWQHVPTQVKLRSSKLSLDWARGGIFDNEVAHLFLALVQGQTKARVVSVAEKPKSKTPPPALHTVEMLRMASSKLHIGPKQTMEMAERLYIEASFSACLLVLITL